MSDAYIIRNLREDEIHIPIAWARQEGWNPGIHDGEMHFSTDPEGWFGVEQNGVIIGVASGINYDPTFSFFGFYIVQPEHRAQGIGWSLYQIVLAHMGSRNIGMDGVFIMRDRYESKASMRFAYRNIRWEGIASPNGPVNLVPVSKIPFDQLLAYDTAHFPTERRVFLEHWIRQPEGTALAKTGPDGRITGYGVIRRCFEGHKIGPIFADSLEIAEELYDGLVATVSGETVYFDTPEPNASAVQMAINRGMTEVFGTARMYSNTLPSLPMQEIFGVTTFELG